MPELPEVETLRLGLKRYLIGHKILGLKILDKKLFEGEVRHALGAKITEIKRFGKGLIVDLDNNYSIAFHVKLTGQLVYRDKKTQDLYVEKPVRSTLPNKFTRAIFELDKDAFLYFNDVRRFAWMKILKSNEVKNLPFFRELGPEPPVSIKLSPLGTQPLTLDLFRKTVMSSTSPIKVLLMDQKKISGIGNIYANDALFDAQINPRRPAKSLSDKEIKRLYESILKVLKKGLKYHGSSDLNFVDVLGQTGKYQQHFLVYGQKGKKCKRCGGVIQRIKLGGRGTFFCSICQK